MSERVVQNPAAFAARRPQGTAPSNKPTANPMHKARRQPPRGLSPISVPKNEGVELTTLRRSRRLSGASGTGTPGGVRRRRNNNVKAFSSLSGSTQKALPSILARSRRIRLKRAKRRAFFLTEFGVASTRTAALLRNLLILLIFVATAAVIVETMSVEATSFSQAFRTAGMVLEGVTSSVLMLDTLFRLWACTADGRLIKDTTYLPMCYKSREQWLPFCALQPPHDLLETDKEGKPEGDDCEERTDERPRRCGCKIRGRLQYLTRPWSLLELVTFVPVVVWILGLGDIFALTQFAHMMRLLRLLRVVALRRMFRGMRLLFKVVASKGRELSSAFVVAAIVAVVLAVLVYELERPRGGKTLFRTLFDSTYWSAISLSTVGYGDIVVATFAGRLITGFAIALLIGVFTLPAGVISSGFVELTDRTRVARRDAVMKLERVYRRMAGRKLLLRWHEHADATRGSKMAKTRSAKVLGFRSSMRQLPTTALAQASSAAAVAAVAAASSSPRPPTRTLSVSEEDSASVGGPGAGAGPSSSGDHTPFQRLPPGPALTLSRTEELRRLCMLDPEHLASSVGEMTRAQLRRLVSGLDVLRRCGGNDAVLFHALGKHLAVSS